MLPWDFPEITVEQDAACWDGEPELQRLRVGVHHDKALCSSLWEALQVKRLTDPAA